MNWAHKIRHTNLGALIWAHEVGLTNLGAQVWGSEFARTLCRTLLNEEHLCAIGLHTRAPASAVLALVMPAPAVLLLTKWNLKSMMLSLLMLLLWLLSKLAVTPACLLSTQSSTSEDSECGFRRTFSKSRITR